MTIEKSLGRIEAMLCELLEIAREQEGEATASVDPHSSLKRVRAESGSSVDSAEDSSTSDGIDLDSESTLCSAYTPPLTTVRYC